MALVKYNNNSISAVTSASSIPVGALTHIKTLTASSSGTLSFVHGSSDVVLDSTYPIYKFEFINIHPSADGAGLTLNLSIDSGSNYNVTKTTTFFRARHSEAGSGTELIYVAGHDVAQSTGTARMCENIGNANDETGSGYLHLFNPSSDTFVKHFMSVWSTYNSNDYARQENMAGYGNTTSAINGIQFAMTSGNIDSGTIKLYGIKDS